MPWLRYLAGRRRVMGRFASFGTPITVNLMSGVIGSAFVLFVFLITRGSLADFFSVMIALAISATAMCYVFVFPALVVLRRKYPHAKRRLRRASSRSRELARQWRASAGETVSGHHVDAPP
jgi:glutamate:GABA antiporter